MQSPPFVSSCVPYLGGILPYCNAGVIKTAAGLWKELGQGWERDERPKEYAAAGEARGGVCGCGGRHGQCHVLLQSHFAPAAEEGVKTVGMA